MRKMIAAAEQALIDQGPMHLGATDFLILHSQLCLLTPQGSLLSSVVLGRTPLVFPKPQNGVSTRFMTNICRGRANMNYCSSLGAGKAHV